MKCVGTMYVLPLAVGGALLFVGGCQLDVPPGQNPVPALVHQMVSKDRPISWEELGERLADEDADVRREAVLLLGRPGRSKARATPEILSVLALEDPDELVRVTAIETLARISDSPNVTGILAESSRSDSRLVRLAGVKGLKGRHSDQAMAILLDRLAHDEVAVVRAQAAELLGSYRRRRVLEPLLEGLMDDDFQVSYQSRESLKRLTGRDFEYDTPAWQQWTRGQSDPFAALAGDNKDERHAGVGR